MPQPLLPPDLEAVLTQPGVTDVLIQGEACWVDRGRGLVSIDLSLGGEVSVRALAVRLAAASGRRLDAASPFVDARLPGGLRMHAVLAPVAPEGTCLSFRVHGSPDVDLVTLVGSNPLADVLGCVVRARLSFAVTGGTGSGKTTLLSALLGEAHPGERVILIEDAGELRPRLPHIVRLEARTANVEGAGAVSQQELVRQALRMRPDRLIVGEVRGREIADLLLALNTGHEGGATTLHANAVADVPARLEALGSLAGLDRAALASQALAGLRIVIHLERHPSSGRRGVRAIGLLERGAGEELRAVEVVTAEGGRLVAGPGAGRFHALLAGRGEAPW